MDINEKAFVIARRSGSSGAVAGSAEETDSEEKKKTSYKWVCPGCGLIVRSTKPEIALKCMSCDQQLKEE